MLLTDTINVTPYTPILSFVPHPNQANKKTPLDRYLVEFAAVPAPC